MELSSDVLYIGSSDLCTGLLKPPGDHTSWFESALPSDHDMNLGMNAQRKVFWKGTCGMHVVTQVDENLLSRAL